MRVFPTPLPEDHPSSTPVSIIKVAPAEIPTHLIRPLSPTYNEVYGSQEVELRTPEAETDAEAARQFGSMLKVPESGAKSPGSDRTSIFDISNMDMSEYGSSRRELFKQVVSDMKTARASFYGRENKEAFSFKQFDLYNHLPPQILYLLLCSIVAYGGLRLWLYDVVVGGSIVSLVDASCFAFLVIDYHTIGMRPTLITSVVLAVLSFGVSYALLLKLGVGLRVTAVLVLTYIFCRTTGVPMVLRFKWLVAMAILASTMLNCSAIFFSLGEVAMSLQPILMVIFEIVGRLAIIQAPEKDISMLRRGSVIAACSIMLSMFFASVRLALWLVLWQTASNITIMANLFVTFIMEVLVEGGVIQIYVMPVATVFFPFLRYLYNENSMKCLLVYVSVTQLTEYIPPLVITILYLSEGSSFSVDGLFMARVDQFEPFHNNIPLALAIYLGLEVLVSLGTLYVSHRTGFRYCWAWRTRRVVAGTIHAAMQVPVSPLLTALLLAEITGGRHRAGDAGGSIVADDGAGITAVDEDPSSFIPAGD